MNFATEVETLIRARYPILYVISSEELRVQQVVTEIARKRQKKLFEWSYSTGIVPAITAASMSAACKPTCSGGKLPVVYSGNSGGYTIIWVSPSISLSSNQSILLFVSWRNWISVPFFYSVCFNEVFPI